MNDTVDMQEPWYRNPWVWLVIAIPSLTVVGCMLTIYLAISRPHIIVADDAGHRLTTATITGDGDTAVE